MFAAIAAYHPIPDSGEAHTCPANFTAPQEPGLAAGPWRDRRRKARALPPPRMQAPCQHPAEDPHYPAKGVWVPATAVTCLGATDSGGLPACASQIGEEP